MSYRNKTTELPPGVLARAKARSLRRLAGMVSDEDRDAAEAAVELAEAERSAVAAQKMADFSDKHPGRKMFANARGRLASAGAALAGVKSRVLSMLGITSAPVAVTKTEVTGTDPESVEARVAGMFKFDPRVVGRAGTIERVEQIQSFVDRVQAVDPSGKVLERVSDGTPSEREASAKVIASILDGLSTPQASAPASVTATKPSPVTSPMGLSGVEDAIRREIAGTRTKSVATPSSAKTVPSVASPVTSGTLSSRLSGSARAEAAIRESLGLKPKAEHVHLANKLNPETISK